jgi:hypothetical protein
MPSEKQEGIEVIEALNDKPKYLFFPEDLVRPWGILLCINFVVLYIFLGVDEVTFAGATVTLWAAWWLLAGDKSYEFTDSLVSLPGKAYFNLNSVFIPATEEMFKKKIKARPKPEKRNNSRGKKDRVVPFQIESDLHAIMEINIGLDSFAVILRCTKDEEWSATIPFALNGIHPELYDSQVKAKSMELSESLKDIPFGESVTFMLGCRSRTHRREAQLNKLSQVNKHPLIDLTLASEKYRIKEITGKGFRQEWSQYCFVTWSQKRQDLRKKKDTLSKFINSTSKFFLAQSRKLTGLEDNYRQRVYETIARDIYENCFNPWKANLGAKANLEFRPLTATEIWEDLLWYKFNRGKAPKIPQLIKVNRVGKEYRYQIKISDRWTLKDTLSVLLEGERGRCSCPQHHERRDLVVCNQETVGVLTLERPPERWNSERDQLLWIWKKISDLSVKDTEIYLEISTGNKSAAQENLIKIAKQSTASNVHAIEDGEGINVAATLKQGESFEAQKRLHQGAEPLFAAVTVLVYRKDEEELERACKHLINSFSPAKLIREDKVAWKLWLETLPINSHRLLMSTHLFTERRPVLDNISIRGIMPLCKPTDLHKNGIELVNRNGGYPLHLDLFKHSERAIINGKAGSGKSILAWAIIKYALALNIKVVGIDMSNAGQSTFRLPISLLGDKGSYIDIIRHSINVVQPPDLRNYPKSERDKRLKIWKDSLRTVLVSLAMGQIDDQELLERVDSTAVRLIEIFINNDLIVERYNDAFDNGWRSPQWQNMPVLGDMLFFCSKEKLGLTDSKEIDERAINQINNQIGAKLLDPNIGRTISQPSNIPPNPDITFFALSGLSNENNSYIMSLVAQMACLNAALESPKSLLVMDEVSVLLKKRGFADIVGQRFATGRKEGQSVLIIGQGIDAIANCCASGDILDNTDYWLIGKTTNNTAKTYTEKLGIPPHVIAQNTAESFKANRKYQFSNWLLCKDDLYWSCLYFPSLIALAALANGQDEKEARSRIQQKYPDTELGTLEALGEFSYALSKSLSSGSELSRIGIDKNETKTYQTAA